MISVGFAGTPAAALEMLKALCGAAAFRVDLVVTKPDQPSGRGMKTRPNPVKQYALSHGLTLRQPATRDEWRDLRELDGLDMLVVTAYGMKLGAGTLRRPKYGCVNTHFSLLPRWRGATPVQHAILAGDTKTGVSLMIMEESLDTGPIISHRSCVLRGDETTGGLTQRLTAMARESLPEDLLAYHRHPENVVPQDDRLATHAPRLNKSRYTIDWRLPAEEIERLVRAAWPEPLARADVAGVPLIIEKAALGDGRKAPAAPGAPLGLDNGLDIATGEGALRLLRVRPPGRNSMDIDEFLHGRPALKARLEKALP